MPENNPVFSLDEDLALLSHAARGAGKIALEFFGRDLQVWMKNGDKSPVSEADFAVDNYLKQILLQARPTYGWVSEESTDERAFKAYQRYFVVDPIDGTRGFINKLSQWCISLAIVEKGRPICGVLECPACQEHYSAHSGISTLLNDVPLTAHKHEGKKIRLSCSAPITSFLAEKLPDTLFNRLEFSRHIPSLAYRLAMIASGKIDVVVVRPNSHDWDIAAADIILRQRDLNLATYEGAPVLYGKSPFTHGILLAGHQERRYEIARYF